MRNATFYRPSVLIPFVLSVLICHLVSQKQERIRKTQKKSAKSISKSLGTCFVILESVNAEFRKFPTDAYLRQTSPKPAIHEINK